MLCELFESVSLMFAISEKSSKILADQMCVDLEHLKANDFLDIDSDDDGIPDNIE